ncbi:hypothetical protein E5354_13755 [Muribaculum sp. NM65_B17]|nr:hypothetical protein E5354_13755 [Muribaculum sp. NM65_B17]THG41199.1 hypothetical protein E5985_12415 [Muribaculaceae bacterium]
MRNVLMTICMITSFHHASAWKVVIDPYCLKAVTTNLASQKAIEDQHNRRLDSISAKQNKLEQYTVSMATITELYKVTMENISGFGTESKYYVEIGLCAFDIVKSVPELVKTVSKAKFTNKALCLNELGNLTAQTQQLVADFINIVNNGKIQNPLKGQATAATKSDGYNFLDRYDRLTVANKIYTDLLEIRYKVQAMMAMAQYATKDDLFFAIDPEGWANMKVMQNQVGMLILNWNGLRIIK